MAPCVYFNHIVSSSLIRVPEEKVLSSDTDIHDNDIVEIYPPKLLNSDSYSDEMYHKLAEEYDETQEMSDDAKDDTFFMQEQGKESEIIFDETLRERSQEKKISNEDEIGDDDTGSGSRQSERDYGMHRSTTESYRDAIKRLQCDNPWFWNSFKCLWLDVRKRNFIDRTRSNAITVGWILGPPILIVLWFVCGFIIVAVFVRARIKQVQRKIEELRLKYEPGKITLFDGTVKKYPPTKEEIEAFEDLISSLVSLA